MLRLSAPDGAREIRRLRIPWAVAEGVYTISLELVADGEAAATALLACSPDGWVEVSSDGGANWTTLTNDVQAGVELGPLTADQRLAIQLRVTLPSDPAARTKLIELKLGLGV